MTPKNAFLLSLPFGFALGMFLTIVFEGTGWTITQATMLILGLNFAYFAWIELLDQPFGSSRRHPESLRNAVSFPLFPLAVGGTLAGFCLSAPSLVLVMLICASVAALAMIAMLLLGILAVVLDQAGYFPVEANETEIQ